MERDLPGKEAGREKESDGFGQEGRANGGPCSCPAQPVRGRFRRFGRLRQQQQQRGEGEQAFVVEGNCSFAVYNARALHKKRERRKDHNDRENRNLFLAFEQHQKLNIFSILTRKTWPPDRI
jgi:hypothetical protein